MEACVKSSYPLKIVRALQGREYTKDEWRLVPPELEAEALRTDFLEVRVQALPELGVLVGDAPTHEGVTVLVDEADPNTTATRLAEFIDPPALAMSGADETPEPEPQPKPAKAKGAKGKRK